MSDQETIRRDPSFGMISANRVSGYANLFGVDYPQQHFVRICISRGEIHRSISNDWFRDYDEQMVISMSEVQFARMISSMNTTGVPCTISRNRDAASGEYRSYECPEEHVGKKETFEKEMRNTAKISGESVRDAISKLSAILEGAAIKKSDLKTILADLVKSHRELVDNLPYVVKCAEEAIDKSLQSAKAEISAYHEHALQQIGERAIGAAMIESGTTARELITEPKP